MAFVIVPLDVPEIDSRGDARFGHHAPHMRREIRIVGDAADVALEMAEIDRIEPHECGEQADIRFRQLIAAEPRSPGEAPI